MPHLSVGTSDGVLQIHTHSGNSVQQIPLEKTGLASRIGQIVQKIFFQKPAPTHPIKHQNRIIQVNKEHLYQNLCSNLPGLSQSQVSQALESCKSLNSFVTKLNIILGKNSPARAVIAICEEEKDPKKLQETLLHLQEDGIDLFQDSSPADQFQAMKKILATPQRGAKILKSLLENSSSVDCHKLILDLSIANNDRSLVRFLDQIKKSCPSSFCMYFQMVVEQAYENRDLPKVLFFRDCGHIPKSLLPISATPIPTFSFASSKEALVKSLESNPHLDKPNELPSGHHPLCNTFSKGLALLDQESNFQESREKTIAAASFFMEQGSHLLTEPRVPKTLQGIFTPLAFMLRQVESCVTHKEEKQQLLEALLIKQFQSYSEQKDFASIAALLQVLSASSFNLTNLLTHKEWEQYSSENYPLFLEGFSSFAQKNSNLCFKDFTFLDFCDTQRLCASAPVESFRRVLVEAKRSSSWIEEERKNFNRQAKGYSPLNMARFLSAYPEDTQILLRQAPPLTLFQILDAKDDASNRISKLLEKTPHIYEEAKVQINKHLRSKDLDFWKVAIQKREISSRQLPLLPLSLLPQLPIEDLLYLCRIPPTEESLLQSAISFIKQQIDVKGEVQKTIEKRLLLGNPQDWSAIIDREESAYYCYLKTMETKSLNTLLPGISPRHHIFLMHRLDLSKHAKASSEVQSLQKCLETTFPKLKVCSKHLSFLPKDRAISPLEKPSIPVPLSNLLKLFDSLGEKKGRSDLESFIKKVEERQHFQGVSMKAKDQEAFFDSITWMLQHIILYLKKEGNPQLTADILGRFAKTANLCAAGFIEEVESQYFLLFKQWEQQLADQSPIRKIQERLFSLKKACIDQITLDFLSSYDFDEEMEAHVTLRVKKVLQHKLKIPQLLTTDVDDPFETLRIPEQAIIDHFSLTYSPQKIIESLYEVLPGGKQATLKGDEVVSLFQEFYEGPSEKRVDFLYKMLNDNLEVKLPGMIFLLEKLDILKTA